MRLKKLEISGFKSFAKHTTLEFPARVTGVVGPNGSGKSNIAESIRWVMGEQSMKSLRGKKGEDLIWNGSESVPRVGKASVAMFFDNTDKKIPIDFEEVAIARKIFRDGLNEYYINNSQVRLKDVVELMARIGLGETKHNIIGQGEVDRIILATSRDRREMLEEALGLRLYQLKKNEAERKLAVTEQNMQQAESLIKEIAPHLKFLRTQAEKARTRGTIEAELKEFQKVYFAKESEEIDSERLVLSQKKSPLESHLLLIRGEMQKLLEEISYSETLSANEDSGLSAEEKIILGLESKRREISRELGRLEGRLEVEREKMLQPKVRVVDTRYIQEEIREILGEVRAVLEEEDRAEIIKSHLFVLVEDLENLLLQIGRGTIQEENKERENPVISELEKTVRSLQKELELVESEIIKYENARVAWREKSKTLKLKLRELDQAFRAKQDEERDLALQLERIKFEEEKTGARVRTWKMGMTEMGINESDLATVSMVSVSQTNSEDIKKRVERLRIKLEEVGGIDDSVVKEYEETEARHSFLATELADLEKARASLKELISELEGHIENDFKNGFSKIKEEFHNYFRIIFGGGRASLQLVDVPPRGTTEETEDEIGEEKERITEPGIEISLDLPKKRIKGLTMLSGGERALTSIALLFAITSVNPPPFLILDETDAALDEANSQRYSAILKELSKKTQLILVTHNRETMKCAEILFGVTMGNDGVSKLISLKFEEAEAFTNR